MRFENWLPINEKRRKYGEKPINEEIINLVLDIFNVDKNKFWTNNGTPKINLNKTKYSKDEFLIIKFSLLLNFLICLLKYLLNIFWKKRKKHKLPKTIVIILIIKPRTNPKKKPDASIMIKLPGREKVKNNNEKKKYKIKDSSKLFLINKSNWNKKLKIKSII